MTDSKREVWVTEYPGVGPVGVNLREGEFAPVAPYTKVRYIPAPSVSEAPEPAKAHQSAAALIREHASTIQQFAGERSAELVVYLLELFEREAKREPAKASGWCRLGKETVGDVWELPDSDRWVLVADEKLYPHQMNIVQLEFTDDSEGHGRPYWIQQDGTELSFETYTHWWHVEVQLPAEGPQ
jgi:hypothetical protein